ncbi:MAG TPA: DUF1844 domain-containing protein [Polyangia bacterium]
MGDSDAKGGFKVTDRRSFAEGAEAQPPAEAAAAAPQPGAAPVAGGTPNLPAVDFHTFVLSLGSSALLHLGELEHPDVGAPQKDLPLAKHTIDILVMLEEKTRGNLTPAEEKLIGSLLYDLRLRFIEAQKK